ncbi:Rad52/Rad22 family DNA repair protein [Streptomyces violaceorubidus]|uniref:Rad52/Rad22 family DNA repair protein n=1 Tax=Streptomyces violaceorubidus TaxID=284042 RepID=UPI00068ADAF0|nr:Rad52/Rad22 family DNA repair protein [Streptomyces violaceorubidus]
MAQAVEAPAGTMAEGPTSHTQNQAALFSPYQLRMLHGGIHANRVRMLRGMAHLEAWDVRRQLIRVFGFGGFSIDTVSLDLVSERETKNGERSKWTIVYRAQVRLTLYTPDGRKITHFEDAAAGDAINQPSIGDAHDLAMKTAVSQALKRCAVNLGDQFGLSLYNNGSSDPVVHFSAAHPPQEWKPVEPPAPEPEDPPVQPEPQAASVVSEAVAEPTAAQDRDYLHEAHEASDAATVRRIWQAARADGAVEEYLAQIAEVGKGKAAQGGDTERSAA